MALSTYDITPVNTGGRTRYAHIYGALSRHHDVTILAYDIERSASRTYLLTDRCKIVVPGAGDDDLAHFAQVAERSGRNLHDILCIRDYRFSPAFYAALKKEAAVADVVVAAHPYLAPLAFAHARAETVKIYEAHNVEYDAKHSLFADDRDQSLQRRLADVAQAERLACGEADAITAVSEADSDRLAELYDVPRRKIAVVPNGVDTVRYPLLAPEDKTALRKALGAGDRPVGVFVGTSHPPNVDAYLQTRALLAQAGFSGGVAVIGSVGDALSGLPEVPFEEIALGIIDEAAMIAIVSAADFALQLIFSGAGTNLKLFEYMAARTLVVANAFGRRGVPFDGWCWPAETADDLAGFLAERPWQTAKGRRLIERARRIAEEHYDWRSIAAGYERLLTHGLGLSAERKEKAGPRASRPHAAEKGGRDARGPGG